jgi:uncharacterized protein YwgA
LSLRRSSDKYPVVEVDLRTYDLMDKHLISSDLILMLLSVSPIRGNTKMQKEVFLTWKELFNDVALDPSFFPWKYGAFSKVVEDSLKILESQRNIKIHRRKGEGSVFSITESGRNRIKNKMHKVGVDLRDLPKKKIDWEEWGPKGILRYVYRNYPQYTSKTEVPSLKW